MAKEFTVIIDQDTEAYYVASVPALRGCHTQAKSLDELMVRIREAVELFLEVQGDSIERLDFIGVQKSPGCDAPAADYRPRRPRFALDSYLERDLTKQRPRHLDSSLTRAATTLQLNEAVFVENTQVILDVLEISANDLGELVD